MRPYVNRGDSGWSTRSREHNGRSFCGKRQLRRALKRGERQLRRSQIAEGLAVLEQEVAERRADARREAEVREELERETLQAAEDARDEWLYNDGDYDAYHWEREFEDYRQEREYDDYSPSLNAAYEQLADDERADRREYDRRWDYDWDADPDFEAPEQPAMVGARDGFDIRAWRARKQVVRKRRR